ncbi:MAG: nucleotidyltransferase domain-containing protein [Ignavibacteriae bacterium]|nr:nucleotidyltransferase domain-containing protein [Ignavibacteriota bacterium]
MNTLYVNTHEERVLAELKTVLTQHLGDKLHRMILFGSKARGDAEPHSDIDVAIIVDGMDRQLKREILDIVADIELTYLMPISALVFSKNEFDHLLNRERRIALDIVNEGIAL